MPYLPGQSGNPNGRPGRGMTFAELFQKNMREKIEVDGKVITYKELIVKRALKEAVAGDIDTAFKVMDRCDGKPFQQLNVHNDNITNIEDRLKEFTEAMLRRDIDDNGTVETRTAPEIDKPDTDPEEVS